MTTGWVQQAYEKLDTLPRFTDLTGEDIRRHLLAHGVPEPEHHAAWGGMIRGAIQQGLLVETFREGQMKTFKSHGRHTPLYRNER